MLRHSATGKPTRRARRHALALVLAILLGGGAPGSALADALPTSVVTMGDSYIAGEGGRWLGNSVNVAVDRDRTDRACVFTLRLCTSYDLNRVYVDGTAADGCHRADVAEVLSARLPVDRRINLACSGAVTSDLLRASTGGTIRHGEGPQGDRLLAAATSTRVRMIVVSVGGNDLGFASLIEACFKAYLANRPPCSQSRADAVSDAALASVSAKIERVIGEVRAVMLEAGYARSRYRLVLQTYPAVLPRAAQSRHRRGEPGRVLDGCPFYDADMNWVNDVAARVGRAVKAAAAAAGGVEVLDLLHAFDGHEICAKTAAAVTPSRRPSATGSEWGRAVSVSAIVAQALSTQELFHPNAYGHRALGDCVGALYVSRRGSYGCVGAAGRAPDDMALKAVRKPRPPRR
jgi:lysophospholipase L1-like esterase